MASRKKLPQINALPRQDKKTAFGKQAPELIGPDKLGEGEIEQLANDGLVDLTYRILRRIENDDRIPKKIKERMKSGIEIEGTGYVVRLLKEGFDREIEYARNIMLSDPDSAKEFNQMDEESQQKCLRQMVDTFREIDRLEGIAADPKDVEFVEKLIAWADVDKEIGNKIKN